MVKAKEVSRDAAREVLTLLVAGGRRSARRSSSARASARSAAEDDGLGELVDRAIAADPDAAEQVSAGNMKAIGPLVGYVMRETKGRADGGEITSPDSRAPRSLSAIGAGLAPSERVAVRRESLRTTKPAASRVPPPATSRTTSSPVNGNVPD